MVCNNQVICATPTPTDGGPDLPDLTECPRPMSTATLCFGAGGRTNCGTSLVCPDPTPEPTPRPSVEPKPDPKPIEDPTDEYLGVLESVSQLDQGRFWGCRDNAAFHWIHLFRGSHLGEVGTHCSLKGEHVAGSSTENNMGQNMYGCNAGYDGGWSVCETDYGAKVYEPNGWYQKCTHDDTLLINCPSGFGGCYSRTRRKLKCDGVWVWDGGKK
jgi:hypothetical protein